MKNASIKDIGSVLIGAGSMLIKWVLGLTLGQAITIGGLIGGIAISIYAHFNRRKAMKDSAPKTTTEKIMSAEEKEIADLDQKIYDEMAPIREAVARDIDRHNKHRNGGKHKRSLQQCIDEARPEDFDKSWEKFKTTCLDPMKKKNDRAPRMKTQFDIDCEDIAREMGWNYIPDDGTEWHATPEELRIPGLPDIY